jgi:YgiT-type zinc finger domain-containing protein
VRRRVITVYFSTGRTVPRIPADECEACGEQFLDPEAMAMIKKSGARKRAAG